MSRSLPRSGSLGPALLLLLLSGCGYGGPLVVVTVAGLTSDITQIAAVATLNDVDSARTDTYPASATDFGIVFPAGARGDAKVTVGGLDAQGCVVSVDQVETTLSGQDRIDLSATLKRLSAPTCN